MANPNKTPDEALGDSLTPLPPIEFDCRGRGRVVIQPPLTGEVWFWILTHLAGSLDPNEPTDDSAFGAALIATIGLKAERILSIATGIPIAELRAGVDPGTLAEVCDALTAQLGGEMIAASPFSTGFQAGLRAANRAVLVARGARDSAGAARSTPSKPTSTVETVQG